MKGGLAQVAGRAGGNPVAVPGRIASRTGWVGTLPCALTWAWVGGGAKPGSRSSRGGRVRVGRASSARPNPRRPRDRRVPCSRVPAAAAGWPGRDSGKSLHTHIPPHTHTPALRVERVQFSSCLWSGLRGSSGLVVLVSGFCCPGCGRWAGDGCPFSFNLWYWALHRRQPHSRDSLGDGWRTPYNPSKCRNMNK